MITYVEMLNLQKNQLEKDKELYPKIIFFFKLKKIHF